MTHRLLALRPRRALIAVPTVLLAFLLALAVHTQTQAAGPTPNVKLSGTMQPNGSVDTSFELPKFSPDGARVAYVADAETDGAVELYVAPTSGATSPVRISDLLPSNQSVWQFAWTPDGTEVVFISPQEPCDPLYVAPATGGTWQKLGHSSCTLVGPFQLSDDGSYAVYTVVDHSLPETDIFSVPLSGGNPTKLDASQFDLNVLANGIQITPGSERVVFQATEYTLTGIDKVELFSVPISGGTPVRLNGTLPGNGYVSAFRISPDGQHVVYRADQQALDVVELFSVPVTGGPAVKLNGLLTPGGDVSDFDITPDGTRVIYSADQQTNDVVELYSVPITGGPAVKLNASLLDPEPVLIPSDAVVVGFAISSDSSRVIYETHGVSQTYSKLFSVPMSGGPAVELVTAEANFSYEISPNSDRVVFLANFDYDQSSSLYSMPIEGGQIRQLHPDPVAGGTIFDFVIDPTGERVAFRADLLTDGLIELFATNLSGRGIVLKINGPLVQNGDVNSSPPGKAYSFSPDGSVIAYVADQEKDEQYELFATVLENGAGQPPAPQDGDGNGYPDAGQLVRGGSTANYSYDALGNWYYDLGDGRTEGNVRSVDALNPATLTTCENIISYRGDFNNDPQLDSGWIRNRFQCDGYDDAYRANILIVHESDRRYRGDRERAIWETWEVKSKKFVDYDLLVNPRTYLP